MSKKIFFITVGSLAALVILLLAGIIVLNGQKETRVYNGTTMSKGNENKTTEDNTTENENQVTNTEDNTVASPKPDENEENTYAETEDGNTIPIPPKFKYVTGNSDTGAVIEDEDGNQFVWVPVPDYNSYYRQLFLNNGETNKSSSSRNEAAATLEEYNLRDINAYNEEFDDSIRNYKGFYIARYEAGKETKNKKSKAVSKAGVLPWTQIVWEEAKKASQEMYDENNCFQTDLVNSYAWDTICNWLRQTGTNIDDSVEYGNYQNSPNGLRKVVESASNDRWQTNNIYDMAGNVWEYTTEESGEHEKYHVGRGGGHWNDGDKYPISSRAETSDGSNLDVGFRVVLYLK